LVQPAGRGRQPVLPSSRYSKKEISVPKRNDISKILIIGSGPIVIGQAGEFDYSGTQACKALRKLGYKIILVNSNPATIMTDPSLSDVTYIEPLNLKTLEKIIATERPDALLPNFGGQTGLNLSFQLAEGGVLKRYSVQLIGVTQEAIEKSQNWQAFKDTLHQLGIQTPKSEIALSLEEAERILEKIDLPCAIRPAYTLGGTGGGLVYNLEEFRITVSRGLSESLIGQVLIEESVEGWEELELEVLRDSKGQKITACFIENIDAMGVHTGDSLCATAMMTIAPSLQATLQKHAYAIVDALGVIGGANIQFAHDPKTDRIAVIEVNPRASRSSALASKATGVPIALISSLLAGGLTLDEIPSGRETTLGEYTLCPDHVAVKSPRWAFEKFRGSEDRLGTQMRAVGEVMGIGKNYKEALQKSIRSLEIGRLGLGFGRDFNKKSLEELMGLLWHPSSERSFILYEALRKGASVDQLSERTSIKPWFIQQMKELVGIEEMILSCQNGNLPDDLLIRAKKDGFADGYLAALLGIPEEQIRNRRIGLGIVQAYQPISVSGAEKAAYYYSTYNDSDPVQVSDRRKVMILGSGPTCIGQGIEFDYCCVHAAFALRDLGFETIMVNCNPSTVSTDYDTSDKLYLEPLTVEDVLGVYHKEKPEGVLVQFRGQTSLAFLHELEQAGVNLIGISTDIIDLAEDRDRFRTMMQELGIPHPALGPALKLEDALSTAEKIGYPLMVRPSRAPGSLGMEVVRDQEDLAAYVSRGLDSEAAFPISIEKFLENALECEVDAISDGTDTYIPAVMEHIELSGIHSGDSACVLPSISIPTEHRQTIEAYTQKIAGALRVRGVINVRYAIFHDCVYVLEVSPRVSRTVPLVSKVCNIPLVRMATQVIFGHKIQDLHLMPKRIPHYGVKEAVFPFNMFYDIDPILGPEMRSTGEVLGMADSFELAFYKAEEGAQQHLPSEGTVLISVSDPDKPEALEVAREFSKLGFKIRATQGTQRYLSKNGVECEEILMINAGRPNIVDAIKSGEIQLVINTPIGKRSASDDSYIRKSAIKHKVSYVTTMAAARAAVRGIAAFRRKEPGVFPLQKYYAEVR
jgi:carbamoyl-phosphate synthase large subunit